MTSLQGIIVLSSDQMCLKGYRWDQDKVYPDTAYLLRALLISCTTKVLEEKTENGRQREIKTHSDQPGIVDFIHNLVFLKDL